MSLCVDVHTKSRYRLVHSYQSGAWELADKGTHGSQKALWLHTDCVVHSQAGVSGKHNRRELIEHVDTFLQTVVQCRSFESIQIMKHVQA